VRTVTESSTVRSLYMSPVDEVGLIRHKAGQHFLIRIKSDKGEATVVRTYTISSAPSDEYYRISVKREGRASARLHALNPGDILEVKPPAGQFTMDVFEYRPAVMLAAGIGITPLIAMLRHAVFEGLRLRRWVRPIWLFQAAHSKEERAFDTELADLVTRANGAVQLIRVLSNTESAEDGKLHDYDIAGRIDVNLVKHTLPLDDYDFYLCGPQGFIQSLYDDLRKINIADNRIYSEAFGLASIDRRRSLDMVPPLLPPANKSVTVKFTKSKKKAVWMPGNKTLLNLAEDAGISPPCSCRSGSCGTCRVSLRSGSATYTVSPEYQITADEVLLCQALPAIGTEQLDIDI